MGKNVLRALLGPRYPTRSRRRDLGSVPLVRLLPRKALPRRAGTAATVAMQPRERQRRPKPGGGDGDGGGAVAGPSARAQAELWEVLGLVLCHAHARPLRET
jgi:hypothetical protein